MSDHEPSTAWLHAIARGTTDFDGPESTDGDIGEVTIAKDGILFTVGVRRDGPVTTRDADE